MKSRYLVLLIGFAIAPLSVAKGLPPPVVNPVVLNGVEYPALGDGAHAWVAATEVATRKELWTAKVFRIHTHWWKGEEDNQRVCYGASPVAVSNNGQTPVSIGSDYGRTELVEALKGSTTSQESNG